MTDIICFLNYENSVQILKPTPLNLEWHKTSKIRRDFGQL